MVRSVVKRMVCNAAVILVYRKLVEGRVSCWNQNCIETQMKFCDILRGSESESKPPWDSRFDPAEVKMVCWSEPRWLGNNESVSATLKHYFYGAEASRGRVPYLQSFSAKHYETGRFWVQFSVIRGQLNIWSCARLFDYKLFCTKVMVDNIILAYLKQFGS